MDDDDLDLPTPEWQLRVRHKQQIRVINANPVWIWNDYEENGGAPKYDGVSFSPSSPLSDPNVFEVNPRRVLLLDFMKEYDLMLTAVFPDGTRSTVVDEPVALDSMMEVVSILRKNITIFTTVLAEGIEVNIESRGDVVDRIRFDRIPVALVKSRRGHHHTLGR